MAYTSTHNRGPSISNLFTHSDNWFINFATILGFIFVVYTIYGALLATASELLQRLVLISPLLLVLAVHWLSTGSQINIPIPGSEPSAIHRAGGSSWGLAFLLLVLFFLISYQPSLIGFVV